MLRKLLKYDFRANLKIFLFVWPAILILPLLAHLFISFDIENRALITLFSIIFSVYIFSIVGIIFFAFYISARRFYTGLLGKEGYLMFTLPVKPWQLILSKFIVALTTIGTTLIISIISIALLILGLDSLSDASFSVSQTDINEGVQSLLGMLNFLASISSGILQVYLACALGHQFKKKRLLWSVVMYYVINIVMQIVTSIITYVTYPSDIDAVMMDTLPSTEVSMLVTLLTTIGISLVFFFLTERILRKKLNLE